MENPYQAPQMMNVTANAPMAGQGVVPDGVMRALRGTKGWVRFLAVLGFVMTAFMVLGSFGILMAGGRTMYLGDLVFLIGGIYLVLALLNFFAAFKLNQYASRIGEMLLARTELSLVSAMEAQRGFWKYVGIMAIVVMVFYALALVAAVVN